MKSARKTQQLKSSRKIVAKLNCGSVSSSSRTRLSPRSMLCVCVTLTIDGRRRQLWRGTRLNFARQATRRDTFRFISHTPYPALSRPALTPLGAASQVDDGFVRSQNGHWAKWVSSAAVNLNISHSFFASRLKSCGPPQRKLIGVVHEQWGELNLAKCLGKTNHMCKILCIEQYELSLYTVDLSKISNLFFRKR